MQVQNIQIHLHILKWKWVQIAKLWVTLICDSCVSEEWHNEINASIKSIKRGHLCLCVSNVLFFFVLFIIIKVKRLTSPMFFYLLLLLAEVMARSLYSVASSVRIFTQGHLWSVLKIWDCSKKKKKKNLNMSKRSFLGWSDHTISEMWKPFQSKVGLRFRKPFFTWKPRNETAKSHERFYHVFMMWVL